MKNYTVKSVDLYKLRDIIKSMDLSATVLNYKDIKIKCAAAAEIIDTIKENVMSVDKNVVSENVVRVLHEEELDLKLDSRYHLTKSTMFCNGLYFFESVRKVTEYGVLWDLKSASACFDSVDVIDVEVTDEVKAIFKSACDEYDEYLANQLDEGI